jgi:hypothetical protein
MSSFVRRTAVVGILSAGLGFAGATAAHASSYEGPGSGQVGTAESTSVVHTSVVSKVVSSGSTHGHVSSRIVSRVTTGKVKPVKARVLLKSGPTKVKINKKILKISMPGLGIIVKH